MRQDWQELLDQMGVLEARAIAVKTSLGEVSVVAQVTAQSVAASTSAVASHFEAIGGMANGAQVAVASSLGNIQASVSSAQSSVGSSASAMTSQVTQVAADVATTVTGIAAATDNAKKHVATKLDDLQALLSDHNNLWSKGVDEMIDAVRIGAVPIEELLRLYGDAIVQGQRVRDFLSGLDLRQYVHQVDDLAAGLYRGTVKISEVTDFLGSTQLLFAKQIAETIKLFQQGKVTLEHVMSVIEGIRKLFPVGEFADLAKAIEDALRKGNL